MFSAFIVSRPTRRVAAKGETTTMLRFQWTMMHLLQGIATAALVIGFFATLRRQGTAWEPAPAVATKILAGIDRSI